MTAVRLSRSLVLETRERTPDGAGGFTESWVAMGTLWASVSARTAREDFLGAVERPRVQYRIIVRGAPVDAPRRPRPDQRLRDGTRIYDILTVTEADADGRYLQLLAEEGIAA